MTTRVCPCCRGRWNDCDTCEGLCAECDHGTIDVPEQALTLTITDGPGTPESVAALAHAIKYGGPGDG